MRHQSIVRRAADEYARGNYAAALELYYKLSNKFGEKIFGANIAICLNKLRKKELNNVQYAIDMKNMRHDCKRPCSKRGKMLIFTNLNLSTIDGSTVFVANVINLFSKIFEEVHLLSTSCVGENVNSRICNSENIYLFSCKSEMVKNDIFELDKKNKYELIFVRSWGDISIWFNKEYAGKIVYYWPLHINSTEDDKLIYSSINKVAFQTTLLQEKTFELFGIKPAMLLPPTIRLPHCIGKMSDKKQDLSIVVSYIGTLRPECYSIELLGAVEQLLSCDDNIYFNLAIGKIFYKKGEDRVFLAEMLDRLRENHRVIIEEHASPERCEEILYNSDISFSLWAPEPQNLYQVSTKLLECLHAGCNVICFQTPLYRLLLGEDYSLFIDNIEELPVVLSGEVARQRIRPSRYINNYMLSYFSEEAHLARLRMLFKRDNWYDKFETAYQRLFSNQFDNIYGLYVDDVELRKLSFLAENEGVYIQLFKGVDGSKEMLSEYAEYSSKPLDGEWELNAGRKRLTIGAFGHLASFIKIAKDALEKGYKKILIIEADAIFHDNIFSANARNRLNDFKILYYGAGKWEPEVVYTECGNFYLPNKTTGTFGIALDSSILLECIEEWSLFRVPTDVALWKITDKYIGQCFVAWPNLIICDVARSKTGQPRGQMEISRKFGWDLCEYKIHNVEYVGRWVGGIKIIIDNCLDDAGLMFHGFGETSSMKISDLSIEIRLDRFVDFIEYKNLFIKTIHFFD